jgi:hypothetical protein
VNGRDYVALVRLSNKDDEALADVGERCDRVPPSSLPWLLETGRIEFFAAPRAFAASAWADLGRPEGTT